jgi:phage FluMu gp28-like protein
VDRPAFVCKARELILPNGARVVSLPGRDPDTLAGLTGNVIFTEFGLFPGGGYDHWRVVFPLATRGFKVIVISTPRGKNTKFFELWSDKETYSVHTCDIYQSVEQDGFVLRDNKGDRRRSSSSSGSTATSGGRASTSASSPATWSR